MRIEDIREGQYLQTVEMKERVYVDRLDYDDNMVYVRAELSDGTWTVPDGFDPDDLEPDPAVCPKCGHVHEDEWQLCHNCGFDSSRP